MQNSVTVLFDLNWKDGKNFPYSLPGAIPKSVSDAAYQGIKDVAERCDSNYPICGEGIRHFFVLNIPAQEKDLCDLIGWCKLGGYPYTIRWFSAELTPD